jgi:hypothetical protein
MEPVPYDLILYGASDMLIASTQQPLAFVYDPRGVVDTIAGPIAPRPKALIGLRLGVLDNSKWNANKLLRGAAAALGKTISFEDVTYYVKHSFSKDADPGMIASIAENSDIVLTAIGDCGSCTSCCVRDAIALEKLGVPTACVVTTEFVRETELQRRALGMNDLTPVIIKHPVSAITDAEVAERVEQIHAQAQTVWLRQPSNRPGGGLAERLAAKIARAVPPHPAEGLASDTLIFAGCQP